MYHTDIGSHKALSAMIHIATGKVAPKLGSIGASRSKSSAAPLQAVSQEPPLLRTSAGQERRTFSIPSIEPDQGNARASTQRSAGVRSVPSLGPALEDVAETGVSECP